MSALQQLEISVWPLQNNSIIKNQKVTFRQYGKEIGTAPVVLINHALHSDSDCMYHWDGIIGEGKAIDLDFFTVLAFDIPGNKNENINHYKNKNVVARDVAVLFWLALFELNVEQLFAVIGANIGGGLAWEMATLFPKRIQNILPIVSSPVIKDWVVENPFSINNWLTDLFNTIDISHNRKKLEEVVQSIQSNIHIIQVSDENYYDIEKLKNFHQKLKLIKQNITFYQLDTISNNQLIVENEQIDVVVDKIFQKELIKVA